MVLERIRQLLKERNWSVYELSQRSGVPQSTLSNMFHKCTCPTVPTLDTICKGFEISLSEFFDEDNKKDRLTLQEMELLKKWNTLSPEKKNALNELLKYY